MCRSSLHVSSEMLVTGSTRTTRGHVPSLYHLKVLLTADVIQSSRCTAAAFISNPEKKLRTGQTLLHLTRTWCFALYLDGRVAQVVVNTAAGRVRREKLWPAVEGTFGSERMSEPSTCSFRCFILSSASPAGVSGEPSGCYGVEHLSCWAVVPPVCLCVCLHACVRASHSLPLRRWLKLEFCALSWTLWPLTSDLLAGIKGKLVLCWYASSIKLNLIQIESGK